MESQFRAVADIIALSFLQGLSEVFPISSSGHLALAARLLGWGSLPSTEVALLHVGSFLAIAWWFRLDVWALIRSGLTGSVGLTRWFVHRDGDLKQNWLVLRTPILFSAGLVPTALIGIVLKSTVERLFENSELIPLFLLLNGVVILIACKTRGEKRIANLHWWQFVIIGAVQGIAVFPGFSRFGFTLAASLFVGLNWFEAIKLSFLYSLPAIAGGNLALLNDMESLGISPATMAIEFLMVFAITLAGLNWLQSNMVQRSRLAFWGWYCLSVGGFALIYSFTLGSLR